MPEETDGLPVYSTPPVSEVVCGITFRPLDSFLVPHVGRFWDTLLAEFPKSQEQFPLSQIVEKYGEASEESMRVPVLSLMPRTWMVSEDETRLIQVQRDRLLYNWKRVSPGDDYPHYPVVIDGFKKSLAAFSKFLTDLKLGEIDPIQYELSYVNHIPVGEGWDSSKDLGKLFPDTAWRCDANRFLPEPETNDFYLAFVFPGNVGRLHIKMQRALRRSDRKEIMLLDLTARGMSDDKSMSSMEEWFKLAHDWIVLGFTDITGSEVQKERWGRTK